ncbi:MAG: peptide chain release factor 1 [Clostridiales bacterium]|nr:peptide chain release factor 1 [Clostridiales bacterium]
MQDKLEQLDQRYSALQARLSAPETYSDAGEVARLNRELAEIEEVVQTYRQQQAAQAAIDAAQELLGEPDPELRELAREELREGKERLEDLNRRLQLLLLPKDPNDDKPVIVEIRAGVGGEEAALFAHSLYRMYAMYADRKGWQLQVVSANETELGGVRELIFTIETPGAYSRMKFESGVHRVQRVPETESGGRIHTSTATVAVLPQVDEVDFQLDRKDLRIDTFRSSGAGGQHINKTSSAIRVTHLPTGMVVECQDQRSQLQNKEKALQILRSRLWQQKAQEQADSVSQERRSQVGAGMRNEKIRTYNFPQDRVTDHRIGLTLYQIDSVMDGDLDGIIDALAAARQAELLAKLGK